MKITSEKINLNSQPNFFFRIGQQYQIEYSDDYGYRETIEMNADRREDIRQVSKVMITVIEKQ